MTSINIHKIPAKRVASKSVMGLLLAFRDFLAVYTTLVYASRSDFFVNKTTVKSCHIKRIAILAVLLWSYIVNGAWFPCRDCEKSCDYPLTVFKCLMLSTNVLKHYSYRKEEKSPLLFSQCSSNLAVVDFICAFMDRE